MKDKMLKEVILGYRKIIHTRYAYKRIQKKYQLQENFQEETISQIKNYLLDYLYPAPKEREKLDAAFKHLDDYIQQPSKLLRILLDSASLLFKYGRHLPQILKAGLKALRSFRKASHFEGQLVEKAIELEYKKDLKEKDINHLIRSLPRTEVEDFIESTRTLFETLHNRVLVQKILEIVQHLIEKMKKRPKIYAIEEVNALSVGMEIIKEGDLLFAQFDTEDQVRIIELVIKIERDALEEIY